MAAPAAFSLAGADPNQGSGVPAFWEVPGDYVFQVSECVLDYTTKNLPRFQVIGTVVGQYDPASMAPPGSTRAIVLVPGNYAGADAKMKGETFAAILALCGRDPSIEIPDAQKDDFLKWSLDPNNVSGFLIRLQVVSKVSGNGKSYTENNYLGHVDPSDPAITVALPLPHRPVPAA